MTRYRQFCPVAKAAEIFAERWTPLVLRELLCGSTRFNDLRRGLPLISPSLLSRRLKELESAGVIEHEQQGPRGGEYRLTDAGQELRPVIEQLGGWGQRWVRRSIEEGDLDAGLLMWDLRRNLPREHLPERRVVVRFELDGTRSGRRFWWLVLGPTEVDLCQRDPGYDVDLVVRCALRTLTAVWLGDQPLQRGIRGGDIQLDGPRALRRQFPHWLGLSPFAAVPRPKRLPQTRRQEMA